MQTTANDKTSNKNAELKYVTLAKPMPAKFFYSISFSWSSVFLLLSFRFVFIVIVIDLTHKQRAFVCISRAAQKGMSNVLFRAIDQ